jgi:hypothetical protein
MAEVRELVRVDDRAHRLDGAPVGAGLGFYPANATYRRAAARTGRTIPLLQLEPADV